METPKPPATIENPESQEPTITDYYVCPRCHKIPSIKLKEYPLIEISCSCFEKKEYIIDDGTKDLKELSANETYCITLERYFEEIHKEVEHPKCSTHKHQDSSIYCTECMRWFCSKCEKEHKKIYKRHIRFDSAKDLTPSSICELSDCKSKVRMITNFCIDCKVHLCDECSNGHNKKHIIRSVNNLFTPRAEKIIALKMGELEEITADARTMTEESLKDSKNSLLDKEKKTNEPKVTTVKETVKNTKKEVLLEVKKSHTSTEIEASVVEEMKNKNIDKFFKTLLIPYILCKKLPNYNLRSNLANSVVYLKEYKDDQALYIRGIIIKCLLIGIPILALIIVIIVLATKK